MANTYDVIKDFGLNPGDESVSPTPFWIMTVFRLKYPTTYARNLKASRSTLYSEAVEIRGDPMVITDDCISVSVGSSKTSYLMQASATLLNADVNYLSEIFPGDYVMIWMVQSDEKRNDLLSRIRKLGSDSGTNVNKFSDGLKFVGRVQSLRKKTTQQADGNRLVRYNLNAVSFNEFDAQIFYEEHLANKNIQIGNYFSRLGATLNQLIKDKAKGEGIDINKILPFFLDLLLGKGVSSNFGGGSTDPRLRATEGLVADYAYIVPDIIGSALGKRESRGPQLAYSDILEAVIGVQKYSSLELTEDDRKLIDLEDQNLDADEIQISKNFQPEGTRGTSNRRFTNDPLLGSFLPQIPHFTNKSVWTVLQQYLNPAINEMYTCLRANPDGLVVPTLVVRQLPFNTPNLNTDLTVTRFLNLPKWGIDPLLILDADVGRSDAVRFNFIHIYGDTIDHSAPFSSQIIRNPPIRDDLDVARSGLRSYMHTIPCSPADARLEGPKKWMEIVSDFLMGQHLTLTGTIVCVGIQSPICVGDNIEVDGVAFHIEGVTHSCSIQNGQKNFTTTLALTHGVNTQESTGDDTSIYAGIDIDDQKGFDPGTTTDSEQNIDVSDRPGGGHNAVLENNEDPNNDGTLT